MIKHLRAAACAVAALTTAACASSANRALPPDALRAPASSSSRAMTMDYGGIPTLASARRQTRSAGGGVSATYGGAVVATGTLDANGRATLTFSSVVPRGATVIVSGDGLTVSVVLAHDGDATSVAVASNGDGTVVVTASAAADPSESSTTREDSNGSPLAVSTTMSSLPANLPVSIAATCSSVTVAPAAGPLVHVLVELKARDTDTAAAFRYEGALEAPLSAPIGAGTSRLHVRIFDATGAATFDLQSPVTAQTATAPGCGAPPTPPPPSPSPSATQPAAPQGTPAASPVPATPAPSPAASSSPSPTSTPSISPSPSPSPSEDPHGDD